MTPGKAKAPEPGTLWEGQIMSYDGMASSHPDLFGIRDLKGEYESLDGMQGMQGFAFCIFSLEDVDKTPDSQMNERRLVNER